MPKRTPRTATRPPARQSNVIVVRSMRAFRVIRMIRKIESLNSIAEALSCSVISVLNAYLILLIVMCIYAIMGVTFLGDGNVECFGRFTLAWLTMFRITSGESWAECLPPVTEVGDVAVANCLFIASYFVVVCWTLQQARARPCGGDAWAPTPLPPYPFLLFLPRLSPSSRASAPILRHDARACVRARTHYWLR